MAEVPKTPKKNRGMLKKLRDSYRLLLINDTTFEERLSFKLNRLNVILLLLLTFVGYGLLISAVIAYTPLKTYIPGYSDQTTKMNAYRSTLTADSLEVQMRMRDLYIDNLRAVLSGELPVDSTTLFDPADVRPEVADLLPGRVDSALRVKMDRQEAYALSEGRFLDRRDLSGIFLFAPIRGIVTTSFDRAQGHFGVDIVSKADEAVKACLDGTVTMASWTTDAGHVIQLQHRNDLVSIYKHNSVLLKKVGDRVKAGEAIAIVGNSGELTSGPHLHFELWLQGEPVDPQAYMVFE
jgi:murein DD-endopeptidase MepM/ murein hydrolase activator NlpD